MNANAWVGEISAPLAVAMGLLICFLGYRLLKFTLGIMGLVAGASVGWVVGLSLAPGNSGVALLCAAIGALLGAILYVWVFYLGIFLLGASAGTIVAAALFNTVGNSLQPIPVLAIALAFGVLALLARKFMIMVCTAFSGSYLVVAGLFHLVAGLQGHSPLWLNHAQGSSGVWNYAALLCWLLLALAGFTFQHRAHRTREPAAADKSKPA